MDQIDRDIAELEARIAKFRPTPHKELQMPTNPELRVTVTLDAEHHRLIDAVRRSRVGFPSRAEIVREALTIGLPKLQADEHDLRVLLTVDEQRMLRGTKP